MTAPIHTAAFHSQYQASVEYDWHLYLEQLADKACIMLQCSALLHLACQASPI